MGSSRQANKGLPIALLLVLSGCAGSVGITHADAFVEELDGLDLRADALVEELDGPGQRADAPCQRTCGGKECGPDGCEGVCGLCDEYEACTQGGWCEAPATAAEAPPVRILTLNTCGNSCAYSGISIDSWVASIEGAIGYWDADAILFTELCYGQLSAIRAQLGSGWGYVWIASHASPSGCSKWGTDLRFGMAIVAKHTADVLPEKRTATLPDGISCGDNNPRQLLCATPLIDGRATLTCVTHLSHKAGTCRVAQAQKVAELTLDWSKGDATILAGDLNALPSAAEMDLIYAVDGTGRYLEADQEQPSWWPPGCSGACRSGEPTFPAAVPTKKIDYIFFSAAHFVSVAGDVASSDGSMSDHRLVRGAALRK